LQQGKNRYGIGFEAVLIALFFVFGSVGFVCGGVWLYTSMACWCATIFVWFFVGQRCKGKSEKHA
jgi:hypothetical protein